MNEIDTLSARQERVLIQLEQFKKQLQEIRSGLNLCAKPAQAQSSSVPKQGNQTSSAKSQSGSVAQKPIDVSFYENFQKYLTNLKFPLQTQYLNDLVVNSNPKFIPYCLLALKKLWHDRLSLNIKFHTHSSVPQLGDDVKNFMNKVTALQSRTDLPKLEITVIWHADVGANTELIATPASYAPLQGEVTLLRWITRIGPNEFNHETNGANTTEVDSILDLCFLLINNSTDTKERLKHLRILNTLLGKQQFFGGTSVSIADVAVSSTVTQGNLNDLTPALKSWLQRVSPVLGY